MSETTQTPTDWREQLEAIKQAKAPLPCYFCPDWLLQLARDEHVKEGACEIDDNAGMSHSGDDGVYVQAWVWVPLSDEEEENDDDNEEH